MPLDEFQSKVLALLTEHEELISRLYSAFADNFTEHAEFWRSIAEEEAGHADMLRKLRESIQDGDAHFGKDTFPLQGIKFSIVSVKKAISEARSGKMSLMAALAMARDYENSLIEKDFFKVAEADSKAVKEVMLKLVEDGNRHRSTVEVLLAKVRSQT